MGWGCLGLGERERTGEGPRAGDCEPQGLAGLLAGKESIDCGPGSLRPPQTCSGVELFLPNLLQEPPRLGITTRLISIVSKPLRPSEVKRKRQGLSGLRTPQNCTLCCHVELPRRSWQQGDTRARAPRGLPVGVLAWHLLERKTPCLAIQRSFQQRNGSLQRETKAARETVLREGGEKAG